jgi:phosphoribosyl 1,2-cyclic phosphate phosphodiesterase
LSKTSHIQVTFLGTGTSQGVPVIACGCRVCSSEDSKDDRLRTSVMIRYDGKNYVIDSGPDFRQQMLREKVGALEAVVFTHEHKDHIAGLDDVRAYNYKQKKDMPVYGSSRVEIALHREFHYAFGDNPYPGVPRLDFRRIDDNPFEINGMTWTPIEVMHYMLPVQGFRIGDFTYITDAKSISDEEIEKAKGSKVLVLNALRLEEHISHFNLEQALAMIEVMKPERAYLTHISHLFGTHSEIENMLPENVFVAYDGLKIDVENGQ